MLNRLKSLVKFLGIYKETDILINSFIIGNNVFIVLELEYNHEIVINKVISDVILKYRNFYWFKSMSELELYFDELPIETNNYIFVIIG